MPEASINLQIFATKPKGKPAAMLAEKGITIQPIVEDEGNVDRYLLSPRLAVERRTGGTFLRGIQDKTLFTSAIYLREHFEVPVLILEGEVDYEYSAFKPQVVHGALAAMVTIYGIGVLTTPNLEETVALLAILAQQEQVGVPEISLVPKRKATDLPDLQRRVVEMLPGCGMTLARQLLQHFGSVERIANASATELGQVHGIGAGKAAEMYRVLHAEYEAVDTEKQLEDVLEMTPRLLFDQPVSLVARQHGFATLQEERQIIDLVFFEPERNELTLVELKRGALGPEHEHQLEIYLKEAHHSPLLRAYLEGGAQVRGILATVEPGDYQPRAPGITVRIIDKNAVIRVLKDLRKRRLKQTV